MSCPTLPREVVDIILSNVCRPVLRACSLVCSSWRHSSQKHLFSSITIRRAPGPLEMVKRVAREDADAMRLARHVRSLNLIDDPSSPSLRQNRYTLPLFHRTPTRRLDDSLFIADFIIIFLKQLPVIQELHLVLMSRWDDLGRAASQALLRLFTLPRMKSIELNFGGGVPISLLPLLGSNIRSVCVGSSRLSSEEPRLAPKGLLECDDQQIGRGPRPANLELRSFEDLAFLMSPTFTNVNPSFFNSLRSVSVIMPFSGHWQPHMPQFQAFLESCPYLFSCKLGMVPQWNSPRMDLSFELYQSNGNLSGSQQPHYQVKLFIFMHYVKDINCEGLSRISHWLLSKPFFPPSQPSTLSTGHQSATAVSVPHHLHLSDALTSLELDYHIYSWEPHPSNHAGITQSWTRMDKFLASSFARLQSFSVYIGLSFENMANDHLVSMAEASFPLTKARVGEADGNGMGFNRKVEISDN